MEDLIDLYRLGETFQQMCAYGLAGKEAAEQRHGGGTGHHSIGRGDPLQPGAMLGVSPNANCSCRVPPPTSPTTTSPV